MEVGTCKCSVRANYSKALGHSIPQTQVMLVKKGTVVYLAVRGLYGSARGHSIPSPTDNRTVR